MRYNKNIHPVTEISPRFFYLVVAILLGQSASIANPLGLRSWMNQTVPLALLL